MDLIRLKLVSVAWTDKGELHFERAGIEKRSRLMLKHFKKIFAFLILGIVISLFANNPAQAQGLFIRGDINGDGVVDTVDLRLVLPVNSDEGCRARHDVNNDGDFSEADIDYLENYLFFGGPPPPHPFPNCGYDTTLPLISCQFSSCCTLTTQCNDGIDNDGDGLIDYPADAGCTNPCDSLETFLDQCKDGIDNDHDGLIDYPADCGCESRDDTSETPNPATECNDGIDNDGDGLVDYPCDPGCANVCGTETPFSTTQCSDGIDNDGDGFVDLGDCSCSDSCDNSEDYVDQCRDGIDNDGDGFVDSADCSCNNPCYYSEYPVDQCRDGIDNDGDGLIDLADPACCNNCTSSEFFLYRPCDVDGNNSWTLTDIVGLVGMVYKGAPKPSPLCRADCNASGGSPTLSDIVYLVNKVFKGGPNPLPVGDCCKP